MEYTQRLNHFRPSRTWRLGTDRLTWTDDKGGKGDVPFDRITAVRMRFEPSRAETNRFNMHVTAGMTHTITNINYRGPMDFEDRSEAYVPFVRAFHDKLSSANPKVKYLQGSTRGAYIGNTALTLFILACIVFAMFFFFASGVIWIALAKLVIILIFIPTLFKLLKRNMPGTYVPGAIPEKLLPVT